MCRVLLVILIFCSIGFVNAQELEISGYFESQLQIMKQESSANFLNNNKLRIDISEDISENIYFKANYNFNMYQGFVTQNFLDYIPKKISDTINDSLRVFYDFTFEDRQWLDNVSLTLDYDFLRVRIGKQQLPWGSGYTWNPTDLFNKKNVFDPTYEKEGINAIKSEYMIGENSRLTGVFSSNKDWESSIKAIKFESVLFSFDYSFSLIDKELFNFDWESFSDTKQKIHAYGFDFSGTLLGCGIWGEFSQRDFSNEKEDYNLILLGMDYTFNNGLNMMSEYLRNSDGKTNFSDYNFTDWMELYSDFGNYIGRDYLFFGTSYPVTELINWSTYFIGNLNDKSGMVFPWISYNFNDNVDLEFVFYYPFGDKNSEYGVNEENGMLRLEVYF